MAHAHLAPPIRVGERLARRRHQIARAINQGLLRRGEGSDPPRADDWSVVSRCVYRGSNLLR